MIDFDATPDEIYALHQQRLTLRAQIREHNEDRPRCAGCGCDMPIYSLDDVVTDEQMTDPGYDYLLHEDFRPGDIICFWCFVELADMQGRFVWGRA